MPAASATVTDDYFLIGGGAKVDFTTVPNLLVQSAPAAYTWYASGKSHIQKSTATITSYAIGLKKYSDAYG